MRRYNADHWRRLRRHSAKMPVKGEMAAAQFCVRVIAWMGISISSQAFARRDLCRPAERPNG